MMRNQTDKGKNEVPLLVFPHYMSRFLLMIAVGMSASLGVRTQRRSIQKQG